jgi:hypothetical protein
MAAIWKLQRLHKEGVLNMLKAINIKWDTDGDTEVLDNLPKEMIIPNYLEEYYCFDKNNKYATEEISDWLSNETGFCHNGFEIVKENTVESVEQELYDFLNNKMITGDIPDVKGIRTFKDNLPASDNGIIIDCADGRQIRLTIQIG